MSTNYDNIIYCYNITYCGHHFIMVIIFILLFLLYLLLLTITKHS